MSLLEKLGDEQARALARETTPLIYRIFLFATYPIFADILNNSDDLKRFEAEHCYAKETDWIYRAFRPRGRQAIKIMRERYGLD